MVFIEVKTGRSGLSAREKSVKKAVEEKNVSFNPDLEVDRRKVPIGLVDKSEQVLASAS
jgi:predicted Holliday junction resolvase-like endonuclease